MNIPYAGIPAAPALIAAIVMFSVPADAHADPGQVGRVLHWTDVRAAIENHPILKVAVAETEALTADSRAVGQFPNPALAASVGRAVSVDGNDSGVIWGIDLTVPLEGIGERLHAARAAGQEAEAARAEITAARVDVAANLKTVFMQAVILRELVAAAQESVTLAGDLAAVAQARFDAGEGRMLDVVRLNAERQRAESKAARARTDLEIAMDGLGRLLGTGPLTDTAVEADWEDLPEPDSVERYVDATTSSHPAIIAAAARIRAASEGIKAERAKVIPEFSIGGFYERELDAHNFGATFAMSLPLWNHNKGGIAAGVARKRAADGRRELVELELSTGIAEAHASARAARENAKRYRDHILKAAREAAEIASDAYKAGEIGLADVLDANRALSETRIEMLEAFLEGWVTAIRLTALAGGEQ